MPRGRRPAPGRPARRRRAPTGRGPRRCSRGSPRPGSWWPSPRHLRRAGRVDPGGPRQDERGLAPGRQRLVGAHDHRVGAERECMRGQVRMEAEVRGPGRVDHERHVVSVGDVGQPGDVADGADVRRVPDEHGADVGVALERVGDGRRSDAERQPGRTVRLGSHPHRREAGEHQPEQHASGAGSGSPPPGRRRRRAPGRPPGWHGLHRRPRTGRHRRPRAGPRGPRRRPAPRGRASSCRARRTTGRRRPRRRRPGRVVACDRGW